MAIQQTTNLTNSIRAQYEDVYLRSLMPLRLYDQLAIPFPGLSMSQAIQGSSVSYPFLSDMNPGVTAISQTADVTPQTLRDATASITPTSRGEALQWAEAVDIQAYTNYGEERFMALGKNAMESIDLLAQAAATQGTFYYQAAARASLDAGTSGHRASDAIFARMAGYLMNLKVPTFANTDGSAQAWACIMHPYVFHDIRESGNVDSIGLYLDQGIHLNWELGKIGNFRLVVNPWAKVFYGAGADNATNIATTLNDASCHALDTTFTVTSGTSIAAGMWLNVGTEETGSTHYPTNERVYVTAVDTNDITFLGEGSNGGLRFDHATGVAVNNNDSAYTMIFGGPSSLVKLYAPEVGEYGMTIGPKKDGLLDQWASIGWKFYGGYDRLVDNRVLRVEVSTSYEA